MSKSTAHNRSRRAFLTRTGGLAAAALMPAVADAQPQTCSTSLATWGSGSLGTSAAGRWRPRPSCLGTEAYIPALLKRPGYLWAAHCLASIPEDATKRPETEDPTVPTGGAVHSGGGRRGCKCLRQAQRLMSCMRPCRKRIGKCESNRRADEHLRRVREVTGSRRQGIQGRHDARAQHPVWKL